MKECAVCRRAVDDLRQHLKRDHSTWELARFAWQVDPAFAAAWWIGYSVLLIISIAGLVDSLLP